MVKADHKRDYYADLDLPSIADSETIKKRFRELAKLYHPDRNPGREVDVVPKFQAIQAAHEILGDPIQKAKYDAERAKLAKQREAESAAFRKPAPPRRTDSGFPNGTFSQTPAGRRDASASRYAPQNPSRARPQPAASAGADKFAQFARAAPQQWDRTRYEEAARAEGLRGMNAMRGGQMPQTSPLRTRPPTAPKNGSADSYSSGPEPSPGFPGLNRTASQRRGRGSHATAGDEPPSTSAYAHYHRDRDHPPSTGPFYGADPQSQQRPQDSGGPLRYNRSFQPEDLANFRPGLSRTSSKYARTGGERTEVNTANINRSSSVRNSPVGRRWEDRERGPFGNPSSSEDRTPRPRHRSHSPQTRPPRPRFEYASESTSSDEDYIPPPGDRKKATLRRPHTMYQANGHGPGLTGYFPNTNYTRVVDDSSTYAYPAPKDKGPPLRKPFSNMTSPLDAHDPNANEPPFRMPTQEEKPRHNSHDSPDEASDERSKFSAEEWHERFDNHADLFSPPEPVHRDRKSPTRNPRASRSAQARSFAPTKDGRRDAANGNDIGPNNVAGVRHVDPDRVHAKTTAFPPGKLASDFAKKVNGSRRGSAANTPSRRTDSPKEADLEAGYTNGERPAPEEMDVDSPAPPDTESGDSTVNVTVEEAQSPTSSNSNPSPRQHIHRHHSDPQADGFNLNELKSAGPFVPSNTGLKDLGDLTNSLPFQSRSAETLEALHPTNSSTLRHLNLPRPPTAPKCPSDEELDQQTWRGYGDAMQRYMHDWTKFNAAMIEHFTARQQAVTHGMWRNWVCAQGDGASAEDFEASGGSDRAGYATYMTWLEDDRKCRAWWDVACEEHRVCMEGLGRIRRRVKELNSRAGT